MAAKQEDMFLEGNLGPISVPDLLSFLNMIKTNAEIAFTTTDGSVTKTLKVEEGELVFAASSDPAESLSEYLLRHGKITQDQVQQALEQIKSGKRLGKILVQMGALSPKGLWWGVKNQVLEIIYSLFTWKEGSFRVTEHAGAFEEKIKLSTSTVNIVMEGIRRQDEWPMIRERIPNDQVVVAPAQLDEQQQEKVHFYDEEEKIYNLLDGERTVRDIIHLSSMDEFETTRTIYSFLTANLAITKSGTETEEQEQEDTPQLEAVARHYNTMFEVLRDGLAESLQEEEARDLINSMLAEAQSSDAPVLEGVEFDDGGNLDVRTLMANVSELPTSRRSDALEEALNNLLSFLLFEVSRHMEKSKKAALFSRVETMRAQF